MSLSVVAKTIRFVPSVILRTVDALFECDTYMFGLVGLRPAGSVQVINAGL